MAPTTETNRTLANQFARFLVSGVANTILTFVLYEVFDLFLPYWLAFTLSFAAGIVFVAIVNTQLVFAQKPTMFRVLGLASFYFLSYVASLGGLTVLVDGVHIPSTSAPFGVIIVMLPVNFFGSRLVLRRTALG